MMDNQTMDDNAPEQTPIDAIIGQVQGYMKDPKTITPETLQGLLGQLTDLKSYLDGEETQEPQGPEPTEPQEGQGGLMAAMGGKK